MSEPPPNIPNFDGKSLALYFWENWAVIKRYWVLFIVSILVAGFGVGYVIRLLDTRQIDILTTSNNQLRDYNTSLAQNAATVPPSQWRRLTDPERAALISGLRQWISRPAAIAVYAVGESESRQYAAQFVDVIRSLNIEPHPIEVSLFTASIDVGLMVGVQNYDNPPPAAREFLDILTKAGLKAHFTPWNKFGNEPGEFDLFVGPKPW